MPDPARRASAVGDEPGDGHGLRETVPDAVPAQVSTGRNVREAGWTITTQVLSALSNLVVSLAVGRAGGERLLGEFAIAFTIYLLLLGFQRALISEPLMAQAVEEGRLPDRAALGCAAAYAVGSATATAAAGLLLGIDAVVYLAPVLPALLLHDLLRYAALRRRQARRAAVLDGTWLLVVLLAWPVLTAVDTVAPPILLWGGAAGAAALWGLLTGPGFAPWSATVAWWKREARRFGGLLAFDSIVHALATQGVFLLLVVIIGVQEIGRLRAATVVLGPTGTVLVAFNAFFLPRLASRARELTGRQAWQLCAASTGISLGMVGVTIALAPMISRLFFDGRIDLGYALVVPIGMSLVLSASTAGLVLHLKALRRIGLWTVTRLVTTALGVPILLYLADQHGLQGAVTGLVAEALLIAAGDVFAWRRAVKGTLPDPASPAPQG